MLQDSGKEKLGKNVVDKKDKPSHGAVFKIPKVLPPRRILFKKTVLDEESYVQEMEKIIQRDFFPDLEKLHAQNDYLEALETNDTRKLRELYAKYSSGHMPSTEQYSSPATFETPVDTRHTSAVPGSELRRSTDAGSSGRNSEGEKESEESNKTTDKKGSCESLDEYLAKHTSEDNQSFQEIMEEVEKRMKVKYAWLYEAEEKHAEEQQALLALPSVEEQVTEVKRPASVATWGYQNKNYIMYVPDGVSYTPEEQVEMAKKKMEVVQNNTRFNKNPFNEQQNRQNISEAAQTQAKTLEGKIGVDGKVLVNRDEVKINGYGFVKTPSPAPGVEESPLMTWGEIEGTPFRLDASDTPVTITTGPSFRIPNVPERDKVAHDLAEKAGQKHRDKKNRAMQVAQSNLRTPSPHPGSAMDQIALMSPAAQRLATSQLGIRLGTDKALRASYTPSPRRPLTDVKTPTPVSLHRGFPTPPSVRRGKLPGTSRTTPKHSAHPSSLTDDLLNLPKRPRAADFF